MVSRRAVLMAPSQAKSPQQTNAIAVHLRNMVRSFFATRDDPLTFQQWEVGERGCLWGSLTQCIPTGGRPRFVEQFA